MMPKEKQVRMQSKRAASKEALKQMHLLLDDENKFEISSDDDDVIEVEVQPPKKKYKLSHRKSSDGNDRDVIVLKTVTEPLLDMEVVIEELSPSQKTRRDHLKKESQEVDAKIEQLLSAPNTEVIYNGVYTTALEIAEQIQNILSHATASTSSSYTAPATTSTPAAAQQSIMLQQPPPPSYQLVMDPRLGVIVGAVSTPNAAPNTPPLQLYQPPPVAESVQVPAQGKGRGRAVINRQTAPPPLQKVGVKPSPRAMKTLQVKQNLVAKPPPSLKVNSVKTLPPKPILPLKAKANITPSSQFRPNETTVEGGLSTGKGKSIDLTEEARSTADSKEVSFNKLQGRTYPSLVVVARPHLRVKDLAADRSKLDIKVKTVLMFPPTKFTEWLIQQGLVRSDQKCSIHPSNSLKLGMYSDVTKFPHSGGYVWISECCPQRFVSVFSGSLFEGSQNPPMAILKLLYHWCCQTIVQNVTQWVKVDNLYVKGMYTWLRSICTVATHTHIKQLGGPGVKVQVGVISLGTTSQDGNKREVKVEVLGILETATKHIRLRAVEPLTDGERNYKKRFLKILEPVYNWVHPASIIVTDLTVDKATLHQMGFLHVVQSTSTEYAHSNRTIMEYLRRIVPRMFQNTLSLLSRQIIQQFLDELVWREWYGTSVLQCFDFMIQHISEQTRYDSGTSLVVRLNKVSSNPFKNWAITFGTPTPTAKVTEPPKRYSRQRKVVQPQVSPSEARSTSPDVPEQLVPLENYYYGTITPVIERRSKIAFSVKCPFCRLTFSTNISLMNHLFRHAHNVASDVQLCRYCLTIVPTANDLLKHINTSHPDETKFDNGFVCLICESHFRNPFILGKHMSKEHCPSELPYLCGTCGFRCSNHKQAVDHFYQQHDNSSTIQCPFCLKSTTVHSNGRNIVQNMTYFKQHLQKHQKKALAKRCGRCVLWFIQKEFLKDHQAKMHVSQRGKIGLVPSFAPRNGVMVPKSKMDKSPDDGKIINFSTLFFNVGNNLTCKECEMPLNSSRHFASLESCQNSNCQYTTCCATAMQQHVNSCREMHAKVTEEKLPYEMHCICGYSDTCGNQMAKHLAICERKSAYPSKESARAATLTQCMLDVLGLVRKPEENKKIERSAPNILKSRGRSKKTPIAEDKVQLPKEVDLTNEESKDVSETKIETRPDEKKDDEDVNFEDKEVSVVKDAEEKEEEVQDKGHEEEKQETVTEPQNESLADDANRLREDKREEEVTEQSNNQSEEVDQSEVAESNEAAQSSIQEPEFCESEEIQSNEISSNLEAAPTTSEVNPLQSYSDLDAVETGISDIVGLDDTLLQQIDENEVTKEADVLLRENAVLEQNELSQAPEIDSQISDLVGLEESLLSDALAEKLPLVETLESMDVDCSDLGESALGNSKEDGGTVDTICSMNID